jgi:hypothetical protein
LSRRLHEEDFGYLVAILLNGSLRRGWQFIDSPAPIVQGHSLLAGRCINANDGRRPQEKTCLVDRFVKLE